MPSNMPPGGNSRWKPGQSGNPKGRPTGKSVFSRAVRALLEEKVRIVEGGSAQEMTKFELLLKRTYEHAEGGNMISTRLFLNEARKLGDAEEAEEKANEPTPQEKYLAASQSLREKIELFRAKLKDEEAAKESGAPDDDSKSS